MRVSPSLNQTILKRQQEASDPFSSVWVNANAGTGKTKVLVDRYIRLLLEGVHPSHILCLTFTKAAAGEMTQRIFNRLGAWVSLSPERLEQELALLRGEDTASEHHMQLARQLFIRMIDEAGTLQIQTIHSFCQALLSQFPDEAGINPLFQLLEDRDSKLLMLQARRKLLALADVDGQRLLKEAIDFVSDYYQEATLGEMLHDMVMQGRSQLVRMFQGRSLDAVLATLPAILDVDEHADLGRLEADFCQDLAHLADMASKLEHGKTKESKLAQDIKNWIGLSTPERIRSLDHYIKLYVSASNPQEPKKIAITKAMQQRFVELETMVEAEIKRVMVFQNKRASLLLYKSTRAFIILAHRLLEYYQQSKNEAGVLDYGDLIHTTLALLSSDQYGTWVQYKLDQKIHHLMVDEAQDTSKEQWQVILSLCERFLEGSQHEHRSLFVVGDEKQSIYRFQGADISLYHHMKELLSHAWADRMSPLRFVNLEVSFRSTTQVLECVDQVLIQPEFDETRQEGMTHPAYRLGQLGSVVCWGLLENKDEDSMDDQQEDNGAENNGWLMPIEQKRSLSPEKSLAYAWADIINGWLEDKRYLPAKERDIEPGDILLLVRKRGPFVTEFIRACRQLGVPVAGVDRLDLMETLVVKDLLAFAQAVLLPEDNLTLATVLKGPFFGVSEEDLYSLCYNRGTETVWERLQNVSSPWAQAACATLHRYSEMANYRDPFSFFSELLEIEEGKERCIKQMGHEVMEPIEAFLELVLSYQHMYGFHLQEFLQWVDEGSVTIKRELESGVKEVRIMTVHASKGLQAPIVIIPDAHGFSSTQNSILWLGKEVSIPLWVKKKEIANDLVFAVKEYENQHDYQESLRLLYVALTRAEDELHISGKTGLKNPSRSSWYDLVRRSLSQLASHSNARGMIAFGASAPFVESEYDHFS
ncbi:MAG: UvrD-helicase domain-containing protein [Alphaproteobacteria bacterium]|nr:UvrD-helicase domain-containing protein [Alphaproteobacteria bacterium]